MKVNHNMAAVRTNLNLNRTNAKLDNSTYRLSSGYKINAAKDDPAGYAILKRLNRQIRGLDQAHSNAADGVSVINTAEGTLAEIHSMLQRMNELATQAANDSNTPEDRDNLQAEVAQLKEEINRIADTTDYNGRILLNGNSQRTSYVAKTNGTLGNSVSVLRQSTTVKPGKYDFTVIKDPKQASVTVNLTAGTFSLNDEKIVITDAEIADKSAYEKIQKVCDRCNVTLVQSGTSLTLTTLEYGADQTIDVSVGGVDYHAKGENVEGKIQVTPEGFKNTAVLSYEGNVMIVTDTDGFELKIKTEKGAAAGQGTLSAQILDASTIQLQIGSETEDMMELVMEKVSTQTLGIHYVNVSTREGASDALESIHNAIDKISTIRSKLGAYENRLNYAMDNLDTQSYNVEESTSRIGDTDMAKEMTSYTELNVLEQATSTILSKANQRAETILQLLQS